MIDDFPGIKFNLSGSSHRQARWRTRPEAFSRTGSHPQKDFNLSLCIARPIVIIHINPAQFEKSAFTICFVKNSRCFSFRVWISHGFPMDFPRSKIPSLIRPIVNAVVPHRVGYAGGPRRLRAEKAQPLFKPWYPGDSTNGVGDILP